MAIWEWVLYDPFGQGLYSFSHGLKRGTAWSTPKNKALDEDVEAALTQPT